MREKYSSKNDLIYIIADVILKVILEIASDISFHGISPIFSHGEQICTGKDTVPMIVI